MSEEAQEQGEPTAKKGGRGLVMIAAVAALLAGSGAGAFVVGPRLAGGDTDAADDHGASGGGHGEKKKGGGHGGGHGASPGTPVFAIENLVVNPAGTQGTRFLIATIALEADGADTATELTARDPEIRDLLLGLLSKRTVEQLSNLDGRDSLKDEIRAAVEGVIGRDRIVRVFIPQYVLQ